MRRSDHPNRPSATIWWCLSSAKTLLMPRRNAAFLVGVNASSRYSKWPVFSCPLMAGFGCPPRGTATVVTGAGNVDITLVKTGFVPVTTSVRGGAGATQEVMVELQPQPSLEERRHRRRHDAD